MLDWNRNQFYNQTMYILHWNNYGLLNARNIHELEQHFVPHDNFNELIAEKWQKTLYL